MKQGKGKSENEKGKRKRLKIKDLKEKDTEFLGDEPQISDMNKI